MDEEDLMLLGNAQHTLQQRNSLNVTEVSLAFQQLKDVSNHILEGNRNHSLNETWRLETLVSIVTDIRECLSIFDPNASSEKSIYGSLIDIIYVLCNTCKFCQAVSASCSKELPESLERLSSLFKLSYQSLKDIMEVAEKYLPRVLADNCDFLRRVFSSLISCSEVLVDIDIMASVAVWKCVKRLFAMYKEIKMCDISDCHILFVICRLTSKTLLQLVDLLETKDQVTIRKYQKVIRFYLGIVLLLLKDFKEVITEESCYQVYNLIYLIQRLSMSEMQTELEAKGCAVEYEEFSNSLLCVIDPLLKDFVEVNHSAQCVLGNRLASPCREEKENEIVHLMIILNVIEHLSLKQEMLKIWMGPFSILDGVFSKVERCSSHLFIRRKDCSVIDMTKCLKEVALYELLLGRLCSFVLTLPVEYFSHIESVMLSNLLSTSTYCTLLASDLWCFISRWGKPELCQSHFIFLGKLLIYLQDINYSDEAINNLSLLMRRLYWFLDEKRHEFIMKSFPVIATNISVWMLIPLPHFNVANKVEVSLNIVTTAIALMQLKNGKENTDKQIVCGIHCLSNILSEDDICAEIPPNMMDSVNKHVAEFWYCFDDLNNDIEMSEQLMVAMLKLTSQLMLFFDGKQIHKVLSVVDSILRNTDSQPFQLECGNFLANLKDIRFPSNFETDCLNLITTMFRFMLSQHNWFVEERAMEALQKFAEVTVYSNELVKFLPSSKKKEFANYLKKEPSKSDIPEEKVLTAICEHLFTFTSPKDKSPFDDVIGRIEKDVLEWKQLTNSNYLPENYVSRVKEVISILNSSCGR